MKPISVDWLKSARSDLLTMEALLGRAEFAGNLFELVNARLKFPTEGRK